VLLVEQNMHRSLQVARRAYVLDQGAIMLAGPAHELLAREDIRRAYLGL
jgi:branched-chain amino acid transport system ATP-binding protein